MSVRSLNKVLLIGNLTRDPELRYTPNGVAVVSFGLATNRQWTTEAGEKKEDAEFHRIVAWNKLAELCSQLLTKGRKVFVEGRLQTRSWQAQDGQQRTSTEVVIDDMIILDSRRFSEEAPVGEGQQAHSSTAPKPAPAAAGSTVAPAPAPNDQPSSDTQVPTQEGSETVSVDDIPF